MLSSEKSSLSPDQRTSDNKKDGTSSRADEAMEIKMKTIIAA
jgi:hypothetical protein